MQPLPNAFIKGVMYEYAVGLVSEGVCRTVRELFIKGVGAFNDEDGFIHVNEPRLNPGAEIKVPLELATKIEHLAKKYFELLEKQKEVQAATDALKGDVNQLLSTSARKT